MKICIAESVIGLFAYNERGEVVDKEVYVKDSDKVAEMLLSLERGVVTLELKGLCLRLIDKGFKEFVLEGEEVAKALARELGVKASVEAPSIGGSILRGALFKVAKENGFIETEEELSSFIHSVSMALTRRKLMKAAEKRDLLIVQAIMALDEVDKILNLSALRIREWYGVHFPEIGRIIDEHEEYLKIVSMMGLRGEISLKSLEKLGIAPAKAERIELASKRSLGARIAEEDVEPLRNMASLTLSLYDLRRRIEGYIDVTMQEEAPNIRGLVGPFIGARLIALAGGLEKLAKMPSSTIQVLGAEKALFRSLKTGARPPKHGIIFQHPEVHKAPKWQRGKIARVLASKLAIASRIDSFTGTYIADELRADFEDRLKGIRETYAKPPKRRAGGR